MQRVRINQKPIETMKVQILQVLQEEQLHFLNPRTIVRKMNKKFPEHISFWERLRRIFWMTSKQLIREKTRIYAEKELLKEGKIVSCYGAYKFVK